MTHYHSRLGSQCALGAGWAWAWIWDRRRNGPQVTVGPHPRHASQSVFPGPVSRYLASAGPSIPTTVVYLLGVRQPGGEYLTVLFSSSASSCFQLDLECHAFSQLALRHLMFGWQLREVIGWISQSLYDASRVEG